MPDHIQPTASPIRALAAFLLGLFLVFVGVGKIWLDPASHVATFQEYGLPDFMPYLTGALEIAAGLMLIVPALRTAGGLLTALLMTAATAVHWTVGDGFGQWWLPLTLALVGILIVWARPVVLPVGNSD